MMLTSLISRRRPPIPNTAAVMALAIGAGALSACGTTSEQTSADSEDQNIQVAVTSSADLTDVVGVAAPIEFGQEYGLQVKPSDVTRYDSHSTATQVMLSGNADVVAGSFLSDLVLAEKGRDIKVFCPFQRAVDNYIVGVGDVNSLSQLAKPGVKVGVGSEGDAVNAYMNSILLKRDAGYTVSDLKNTRILNDHSLRMSALLNDSIDAAVVHLQEVNELREAKGEDRVHLLGGPEDVPQAVFQVYAARGDWLRSNSETAAALCAAVLKGNRVATNDFDRYREIARQYIDPAPNDSDARAAWELAQSSPVWPKSPSFTAEVLQANVKPAMVSNILSSRLEPSQVYERDPAQKALELLESEE